MSCYSDNEELFKEEACNLLFELKENYLDVQLVPAPESRFEGHCIRVACKQNPKWYRRLYHENFKRHRFIKALKRIRDGKILNTYYENVALKLILDRLKRGYETEGYFVEPIL